MTSPNGNIFRVTGPLLGNPPVTGEFTYKGQWHGALMFSLICAWTNDWANNRDASDLIRQCAHCDVTVMVNLSLCFLLSTWIYSYIVVLNKKCTIFSIHEATLQMWTYIYMRNLGLMPFTHSNIITMKSQRARLRFESPASPLFTRLFGRRSKKTSKLRVTGLCAGNSPGTGEFPAQMASYAGNVSIWWRHHVSSSNGLHVGDTELGDWLLSYASIRWRIIILNCSK